VLVCGGRDFGLVESERQQIFHLLDRLHAIKPIAVLIHGGARGVDTAAGEWALMRRIQLEIYRANWMRYGLRAGFVRNQRMLDEGKPHLVAAFPGGRGTNDMIKRAGISDLLVLQVIRRGSVHAHA
jgi:hypothetical protein